MMRTQFKLKTLAAVAMLAAGVDAQAFTFQTESVSGNFDSTVTLGVGVRTKSPACGLINKDSSGLAPGGSEPGGSGAPAGCTEYVGGLGDQGDLNYKKGDAFTTYLKGTHELLLKLPDDWKFLGRVSWLRDFSATQTTGYTSVGNPSGVGSLSSAASEDLRFKARLLDFWVSKELDLGDQKARVRVGNQVISWGESLFIPGGINQTNSMDLMRLAQPGTQLKEVFLPAPIVSVASGLGHGLNIEGYVQAAYNQDYFPPTGSYWSTVNGIGKGDTAYGLSTHQPKEGGQYGVALRWAPEGTVLNLGLYAMRYTDKSPNLSYNALGTGTAGWVFAEDRTMYGVSTNFPLGNWAIGSELSYRPRDAVSLNPGSMCTGNDGNCFVDEKKFQWHLTALLSLTPSDYGGLLNALGGADTATLMAEAVVVKYPGLKQYYNGDPISAGAWSWGLQNNASGTPAPVGTSMSDGYNFDFSWTYDGSLLPGWQVTPEVYYFKAVSGRTPNLMGQFMAGAQSANFIVTFAKNPTTWQWAINYAKFWGGSSTFDQPLRDRDFIGAYVSRNF